MRAMILAMLTTMTACFESPPTRWEAAHELARVTCDESPATRGNPACYETARVGWCPTEDVCREPIDDLELYDRCLVRVRNECWRLFHW